MDELPDLTVKQLRAIVSLSRCGKFTAAAAELRISQPGLSRTIRHAEHLLGVKLFARGTRSVAQTEAGRAFIPAAERMLDELLQQARRVRTLDGTLRGQLIISCLMSISHRVLPAALVRFRQQHPQMHIRIRESLHSGVQEDLRSGLADFGIGNASSPQRGISMQSVVQETCYAVLPPRHRLAKRASLTLRDLAGECFISMPTESGMRRLVDAAASRQAVALDHGIVINQYQSMFDFVSSGLGVCVVPAVALPRQGTPALAVCALRPLIRRRIGVMHLAERPLSPASREFLGIFRPMLLAATRQATSGGPVGWSPQVEPIVQD